MVFGERFHPSASSPRNDRALALAPYPGRGLRALCAAIFLANSFLSSDIVLLQIILSSIKWYFLYYFINI
tara:strand:- start:8 stop:217 length:210 start_codon:yes stop_codon:yes gene_type:complete